jgi:hypothetical protein
MDDFQEQIRAKRDAAARGRQIAQDLTNREDRSRVLAFASDLDAQADTLEGGLSEKDNDSNH